MKKFLSLLLVLVMLVSCLAACSGDKDQDEGMDLSGTYDVTLWVSEMDGVAEMTQALHNHLFQAY